MELTFIHGLEDRAGAPLLPSMAELDTRFHRFGSSLQTVYKALRHEA